ncbi:MAG: roadblock/LC7 domain-containing protein [Chitinivibrionales bacterium]
MNHDHILQLEDINRLNVILTNIVDKARIDTALLINKSGRLLTSQSESGELDKVSLAALVVGSFASSVTIANMLGETEFNSMYHQGEKKHIRISQVDNNTVLCLIFDNRTNVEKVKSFTDQYTPDLQDALHLTYSHVESDPDINIDVSPHRGQRVSGDTSKARRTGINLPPAGDSDVVDFELM